MRPVPPQTLASRRHANGLFDCGSDVVNLVHASDIHFGKPHQRELSDALLAFVHDQRPHGVVLSGDLTQRAKVREYEQARAFLEALAPYPYITCAGNHDVPLYRIVERLVTPYRNYRRFVSDQLDTILDLDGARLVALSTAAPRTAIVNGRITARQRVFAQKAFEGVEAERARILVLHHHLVSPGDYEKDHPMPGKVRNLKALHTMGVDLVLGGHLHRAFRKSSLDGLPAGLFPTGFPIIHSGTTTSRRGRGREHGRNSLNVIRVEDMGIHVTVYLYSRDARQFLPASTHRYPRSPELGASTV